jgi:hypothetical protein
MSNATNQWVFSVDEQQMKVLYRLLTTGDLRQPEKRELISLEQKIKQCLDKLP